MTAASTSGLPLPTLFVPHPAPKSMKRFPSTSSMSEPSHRLAMKTRLSQSP